MDGMIPENLRAFLKNGLEDCDDGFEYASELNRILNSDGCQLHLTSRQIETIRDFADECKKIGELNHYSRDRVRALESERFGRDGIMGFLGDGENFGPASGLMDLFKK